MEVNQQELANRLSMTDRNVRLLVARGVLISSSTGGYDVVNNRERYRIFQDHNLQAVADRIEAAAEDVDSLSAELEAEPDIEVRRKILGEQGSAVGQFVSWLDLSIAMQPEPEREMLKQVTDGIANNTVRNVMRLCQLQLSDNEV